MEVLGDAQMMVEQNKEALNAWRNMFVEETTQVVALEARMGRVWRS